MKANVIRRIALFGSPGSGKSSVADRIDVEVGCHGVQCLRVRLAEPLYDLQRQIYDLCGCPLGTRYQQDGPLLAALAQHLRRIEPDVLTLELRRRMESGLRSLDNAAPVLVVCEDVRPIDVPAMRQLGFDLVRVWCPHEVAAARVRMRGDVALMKGAPVEEGTEAVEADCLLANDGSLCELDAMVASLVRELLR